MAIFGFQLCYTLIMASFLQKLSPMYSLGSWLLSNGSLFRFLHPTDLELKKISGKDYSKNPKGNSKAKRRSNKSLPPAPDKTVKETFKVPRNAEINLETTKLKKNDVLMLRKYSEYEWLVDYVFYAILVYTGTEIYLEMWKPTKEFNISMIWCFLAIGFVCRNLLSIMWIYFKSATGEISMCITFGFFSFVGAMAILIVDENILEFGLTSAYESFAANSSRLLPKNSDSKATPKVISLPVLKVFLSFVCGLTGTLLVFPGMRIAQMYVDALKYCSNNKLKQLVLHISYFTPVIVSLLWVKPIARDLICLSTTPEGKVRGLITDQQFDILRIIIILALFFIKFILMRTYLQAYLNTAYIKINKMKREAGYTTNIDIQTTVSGVFYYLGIVALQYICPIIIIAFATMALKTLGGYSWKQILPEYGNANVTAKEVVMGPENQQNFMPNFNNDESFKEMVHHAGISLKQLSAVFTPQVFQGLLSFYIWWLCASSFVASSMGIVYHTYLVI